MQLGVKTCGLLGAGFLGIGIPSGNGGVDCGEKSLCLRAENTNWNNFKFVIYIHSEL